MGQFHPISMAMRKHLWVPPVSGARCRRSNVELNEEVGVVERFDEDSGRYIVHLSVWNPKRFGWVGPKKTNH